MLLSKVSKLWPIIYLSVFAITLQSTSSSLLPGCIISFRAGILGFPSVFNFVISFTYSSLCTATTRDFLCFKLWFSSIIFSTQLFLKLLWKLFTKFSLLPIFLLILHYNLVHYFRNFAWILRRCIKYIFEHIYSCVLAIILSTFNLTFFFKYTKNSSSYCRHVDPIFHQLSWSFTNVSPNLLSHHRYLTNIPKPFYHQIFSTTFFPP